MHEFFEAHLLIKTDWLKYIFTVYNFISIRYWKNISYFEKNDVLVFRSYSNFEVDQGVTVEFLQFRIYLYFPQKFMKYTRKFTASWKNHHLQFLLRRWWVQNLCTSRRSRPYRRLLLSPYKLTKIWRENYRWPLYSISEIY